MRGSCETLTQLAGESGHLCILSRSASIRVVFTPPRASAASSCSAARTSWLNCCCIITCAYVMHIRIHVQYVRARGGIKSSTSGAVVPGSCAAGWIVEGCRTVSASPHLLCRKVLRPRRHRRVPRLRPYRRRAAPVGWRSGRQYVLETLHAQLLRITAAARVH